VHGVIGSAGWLAGRQVGQLVFDASKAFVEVPLGLEELVQIGFDAAEAAVGLALKAFKAGGEFSAEAGDHARSVVHQYRGNDAQSREVDDYGHANGKIELSVGHESVQAGDSGCFQCTFIPRVDFFHP
jgi:hypothetical protein